MSCRLHALQCIPCIQRVISTNVQRATRLLRCYRSASMEPHVRGRFSDTGRTWQTLWKTNAIPVPRLLVCFLRPLEFQGTTSCAAPGRIFTDWYASAISGQWMQDVRRIQHFQNLERTLQTRQHRMPTSEAFELMPTCIAPDGKRAFLDPVSLDRMLVQIYWTESKRDSRPYALLQGRLINRSRIP